MLAQRSLPQLAGAPFLTDGGLETSLIYLAGEDLPCFAAFPLVEEARGREVLKAYYRPYVETAATAGAGFVLSAPTWRANPDWGARLGYSGEALRRVNERSVALMREIRDDHAGAAPVVIEGVLGPRGDGYRAEARMSVEEAAAYHAPQILALREAGADLVGAYTLTYPQEAIGIARAAGALSVPAVISFTVETDGRLPSGDALKEAIVAVEAACAERRPACYMINCAHPTHFERVLEPGAPWTDRIRGLRANASTMSHAELDAATTLDSGDPRDLGRRYAALRRRLPRLTVLGGCCGTDRRHVAAICEACLPAPGGRRAA